MTWCSAVVVYGCTNIVRAERGNLARDAREKHAHAGITRPGVCRDGVVALCHGLQVPLYQFRP